jgi:ubiquinone/menaquinone biosynthesis C-methylase UbiE
MFLGKFMLKGESTLTGSTPAEIYEEYFVPAIFGQWAMRAVQAAAITIGERVLDAGCGTGVAACAAQSQVGHEGKVSGLDCNRNMLAVAARKEPDIDWRHGDIVDMPFADGSFDVILCQFVLMTVTRRVAALKELNRVLAPGGRMVIAVWAPMESSSAYIQLARLVKETGGEKALNTLLKPFTLGSRDMVTGVMRAAGFADFEWELCLGTARYPSIESFVDIETTATGASIHFNEDEYRELQRLAVPAFQQWLQTNGELVIPLNAIFIKAAKRKA